MLINIYDIENFDEINEELIELLKHFDKERNEYDTDVYLYYDEDTNTAKLDTFVNPGGNSWLNDDHYTIYTDKQRYDSFIDGYGGEIGFIADVLNISIDQLYQETAEYIDIEDVDDIDYFDIEKYVTNNATYNDILYNYFCDSIDNDYNEYYSDLAEFIFDNFNNALGDEY